MAVLFCFVFFFFGGLVSIRPWRLNAFPARQIAPVNSLAKARKVECLTQFESIVPINKWRHYPINCQILPTSSTSAEITYGTNDDFVFNLLKLIIIQMISQDSWRVWIRSSNIAISRSRFWSPIPIRSYPSAIYPRRISSLISIDWVCATISSLPTRS